MRSKTFGINVRVSNRARESKASAKRRLLLPIFIGILTKVGTRKRDQSGGNGKGIPCFSDGK